MSASDPRALLQQYYDEVWQRGNFEVGDSLVAPDLVDHMALPGQAPGRDGHHDVVRMIRAAFPDAVFETHHLVMEGDLVVGHWTMRATHQGEIMGIPPTGRPVTMRGMDLTRWRGGQLVEVWHVEELLAMLQQVGAVPSPGQR